MTRQNELTAERVRELFAYDPVTGVLTHLGRTQRIRPGDRAGSLKPTGYRHVKVGGRCYLEHRLIWLHVYGEWPREQIDHINNERSDNRLVNLRDVSQSINQKNRVRKTTADTGYSNVRQRGARFYAYASKGGHKHLGSFGSAFEAHQAFLRHRERAEKAAL